MGKSTRATGKLSELKHKLKLKLKKIIKIVLLSSVLYPPLLFSVVYKWKYRFFVIKRAFCDSVNFNILGRKEVAEIRTYIGPQGGHQVKSFVFH